MNGETTTYHYSAPVAQLLSLGRPPDSTQRDYYTRLGISSDNIADLIRMAVDKHLNNSPSDSALIWAPVHAWRVLGQLRAAAAVESLLSVLERIDQSGDDWVASEVPKSLGEIGAAAIGPAANYLADTSRGEWARVAAAESLSRVGRAHSELRAECVAKLAAQLEKFSEQSETINAFLVSPLWDLSAVEAMPVIERAFAAGCVDESVTGDVEDVRIHFGLQTGREHPPKPNRLTELREEFWAGLRRAVDEPEYENAESNSIVNEPTSGSVASPYVAPVKIGRNEPCPCGSGKKYKKCCGA